MQISQGQGASITPLELLYLVAHCQQLHKVSHGNSFRLDISHKRASVSRPVLSLFPGAWEKRRLLCSASREKKGACVYSRHTRSQIEDNHQRATGQVDVPRPKSTSAIRIEQEGLFCSCRTAGQTAPQRGADIKTQIRLNKIKILFNRVEARLDFYQNCGIMSIWQSAQLPGGQDSLFCVSV